MDKHKESRRTYHVNPRPILGVKASPRPPRRNNNRQQRNNKNTTPKHPGDRPAYPLEPRYLKPPNTRPELAQHQRAEEDGMYSESDVVETHGGLWGDGVTGRVLLAD